MNDSVFIRVRREFFHVVGYVLGLVVILVVLAVGSAFGQLRVVSWNTATSGSSSFTERQSSFNTVLTYLGQENVNGMAKDIDVLILQEQSVNGITLQKFAAELNTITGSSDYVTWTQNPYNTDGMQTGFVYNSATVQLMFEDWCQTDASRSTSRICLRPVGYGEDADLWIYNTHFKAGTSSSDQARRRDAAIANRWQTTNGRVGSGSGTDSGVVWGADFLDETANIIYAGDFNQRSSYEDADNAYSTMVENPYEIYKSGVAPFSSSPATTGYGQAVDPLDEAGYWHDNSSFKSVHTQNPAGSGFVGGGMDDRFDLQMLSTDLTDGEGLSYLGPGVGDCTATTHSYRAHGNNGTHSLNGAISTGFGAPTYVLAALTAASDHLPVVTDYQLPAKMSVELGTTSERVLVGASVQQTLTVANSADVSVTLGADELDYHVSGGLGLSGAATGTAEALASGNSHSLSWNTTSAGQKQGLVTVSSNSQAVSGGLFQAAPSLDVLDHANPSFRSTEDIDSLQIDFGIVAPDSLSEIRTAAVWNLEDTLGFTASLDLDSVQEYGDTDVLFVDWELFSNLQAGDSHAIQAIFEQTESGTYSTVYLLSLSDEDLPGEVSGATLALHLLASVAAPGDANLDGTVDEGDAEIMADHWGDNGIGWNEGDFNGDGHVNALDASILAANWGNTQENAADVPEPNGLTLMVALLATVFLLRTTSGNPRIA